MTDELEPPAYLSQHSQGLWRNLVPSRAKSIGRRQLLTVALEALDRAEEARLILARDGLTATTKTTGAVHVHPLVKVERESRQLFLRAWADLGLGFDSRVDGRA